MMSKTQKTTADEPKSLIDAYLLGIFAVIVFGSTLPVTRLALEDFGPGFITFARAMIAAILAGICLVWWKKKFSHAHQPEVFIAGVLLIFGFPGFMALAMQTVPASHGGVILGFLPLATALIARLIANENPSISFWILSAIGFVIVASFAVYQGSDDGSIGISLGDFWLILAGVSASTGYVIFGKLSRTTPGWEIICRALILNLPITLIGLVWFYTPEVWQTSWTGVLSLGYLGAFSMFLGFCGWNVALAVGGIARIGQLQLLQIFITLGTSAVILSEKIDLLTVTTAAAITVVIALSRKG